MTTSAVPASEAAIVALVNAAITDEMTFWRAWPGPESTRRMGFLTEVFWPSYEDAAMKTGPRFRRERFEIGFELWEFADEDPSTAGDASDSAMAQLAFIENVLRLNPKLGIECVQHADISPDRKQAVVFEAGWGYAITGTIDVEAYLI